VESERVTSSDTDISEGDMHVKMMDKWPFGGTPPIYFNPL